MPKRISVSEEVFSLLKKMRLREKASEIDIIVRSCSGGTYVSLRHLAGCSDGRIDLAANESDEFERAIRAI